MCRRERFRERTQMRLGTHLRIDACILACICGCVRYRGQCGHIRKRTPMHQWTHLQAYTPRPRRTRTLPCVKLQTLVSRYPDAADGKTGHWSSADVCKRGRHFWRKQKCLRLHISHLHWRASIATAATVTLFRYYAHFIITLFSFRLAPIKSSCRGCSVNVNLQWICKIITTYSKKTHARTHTHTHTHTRTHTHNTHV